MTGYWWLSDAGSEGFLSTIVSQEIVAARAGTQVFVELPVGRLRRTLRIDEGGDRDKQRIDVGIVASDGKPTALIEMKRICYLSQIAGAIDADAQKLEAIREIFEPSSDSVELLVGAYIYGWGQDEDSCASRLDRIAEEARRLQRPNWETTTAIIDTQNFDDEDPSERVWGARSLVMSRMP
jgi:hypothetical protein